MNSIKTKIIVSIIACTLLSAIPVGFMSLRNVYQTSNQGARTGAGIEVPERAGTD